MSNIPLKDWAEDAAFQFKVLHKTSDIYHYLYRVSTIALFVLAVGTLAWSPGVQMGKVCGAIGLLLAVVLLVFQKDIEKIRDYRKHADAFKNVYDLLRRANETSEPMPISIEEEILRLSKKNSDFPVSKVAHWWTQRVIYKEMNLEWLKK